MPEILEKSVEEENGKVDAEAKEQEPLITKEEAKTEKSPEKLEEEKENQKQELKTKLETLYKKEKVADTKLFNDVLQSAEKLKLGDEFQKHLYDWAEEKGLSVERIKNEKKFEKSKLTSVEKNRGFTIKFLNYILNLNRLLDKEGEDGANEMKHLCYSNEECCTYSEKYLDEERDHEYINMHEMGHIYFKNEGLIYDRKEIEALNSMMDNLNLENIENFGELPEDFKAQAKEILDIFQDKDKTLLNKESDYIIGLFNKFENPEEMQKEFNHENKWRQKNKREPVKTMEEFQKIFRRRLMQEMIADRTSYYFMAKETSETDEKGNIIYTKNPADMLNERIKRMPKAQEYLGLNQNDYKKLKETLEALEITEEMRKDPSSIIEEIKKSGLTLEKTNLDNLSKLLEENQKFFDYFEGKLKDKSPEDIERIMKENAYSDDDLEDLFDCMDYGIGDYEFLGSSGGGTPEGTEGKGGGFLEWIKELMEIILGTAKS